MRIDPLKLLVPKGYKFRQKVLDKMFAIAKSNRIPTCHQDDLVKATNIRQEEIETIILYLVRNDYAKHVGNDGDPLYSLTAKGQSASIDKEFLRTGRNERYKTLALYALIGSSIAGVFTFGQSLLSTSSENQIPPTEETTTQQHQPAERSEQESPPIHTSDSVSLISDSAMRRTAVNEKTSP